MSALVAVVSWPKAILAVSSAMLKKREGSNLLTRGSFDQRNDF
jgi:hypothetical protein